MIIDDAAMMRAVVADVVRRDDAYQVVASCANGDAALRQLAKQVPTVVTGRSIKAPRASGLKMFEGLTITASPSVSGRASMASASSIARPCARGSARHRATPPSRTGGSARPRPSVAPHCEAGL